jgi:hypothetical protein
MSNPLVTSNSESNTFKNWLKSYLCFLINENLFLNSSWHFFLFLTRLSGAIFNVQHFSLASQSESNTLKNWLKSDLFFSIGTAKLVTIFISQLKLNIFWFWQDSAVAIFNVKHFSLASQSESNMFKNWLKSYLCFLIGTAKLMRTFFLTQAENVFDKTRWCYF